MNSQSDSLMSGTYLTVRSPAKINWILRVIGRRSDGFHEIQSLMSTVTLYDELTFTRRADAEFVLTCDRKDVPTDDQNLICRAASLLSETCGETNNLNGLDCRLMKRAPAGGGVGGGSSNGATALIALNRIWSLNLSDEKLHALAARLGSDVPFFLKPGSAIISGRGERVQPVKLGWRGWLVLLFPNFSVSTAAVYRAWHPVPPPAQCPLAEPGPPGIGYNAVRWMERAYNMLETPAMKVSPPLREILERARMLADRPVRVSGSGSTCFTAFDTLDEAKRFADRASARLEVRCCVVQPTEQV